MLKQHVIGLALAIALGIVVQARASTILQYGFDATSGNVVAPVNDDSGTGNDGYVVHSATAPVYSSDIPVNTQFVTGIGSVDFSNTAAAISTSNAVGGSAAPSILSAADVFNAGGLTMEVWIKNASDGSATAAGGMALTIGGMYNLGVGNDGSIGYFYGDGKPGADFRVNQSTSEWTHLAVVMETTDPAAQAYDVITSYIDGVVIHSGAHSFPWFLDRATAVGNHQYADWNDYEGLVYEPRVSLGALATSEFTFYNPFELGDFNEDFVVDEADFMILNDNLAGELDGPITYSDGDIDFDSDVDLDDFGIFKELFPGVVTAALGVPEPHTFGLLAIASGLLLTSARSRRTSR